MWNFRAESLREILSLVRAGETEALADQSQVFLLALALHIAQEQARILCSDSAPPMCSR